MNGFKILEWLFLNGNKSHAPERWAALFGIVIIDNDGFANLDKDEVDLLAFVKGVAKCTINPNAK